MLGDQDPEQPEELTQDVADQFAALGVVVGDDQISGEVEFEVWDVNWDAFTAFRKIGTQWRWVSTMSGMFRVGIDWAGARTLLDLAGIDVVAILDSLAIMESAVVEAGFERAAR